MLIKVGSKGLGGQDLRFPPIFKDLREIVDLFFVLGYNKRVNTESNERVVSPENLPALSAIYHLTCPFMSLKDDKLTYYGEDGDTFSAPGENPFTTLFLSAESAQNECIGFQIYKFSEFCASQGMGQTDMLNELAEFYDLKVLKY